MAGAKEQASLPFDLQLLKIPMLLSSPQLVKLPDLRFFFNFTSTSQFYLRLSLLFNLRPQPHHHQAQFPVRTPPSTTILLYTIMQFQFILLALFASLFSFLATAQTPECSTENTCFDQGPNNIDSNRGLAVINVTCTQLTGTYLVQEQRLTCAWGTASMKFDFAIRNLDKISRFVTYSDCVNGMKYVLHDNCGSMGGRQTRAKIMYLSVPPVLQRVLVC
jgi:hypothetical protein